ncbi:unnamed protein product [Prorocentrum cordatum]|uniref:Uncharacterized protein n=1 Tax=Prorocentrum cordatum TaxID=2364126 RepID=A0ABN9VV70_9DINO|nr:unnamed protein product [Polarella glacialis]
MAPLAPVRERRRGRREDEEARKTSGGRRAGQSTCTPLAPRDMSEPPPSACNWTCTCPTTTGAHAAEERTSEEEEEEEEEDHLINKAEDREVEVADSQRSPQTPDLEPRAWSWRVPGEACASSVRLLFQLDGANGYLLTCQLSKAICNHKTLGA